MLRVRSRILKHHKPSNKKKLGVASLLTDDLIVEILSWLPPKFVVRCKMVCKLWRSIIQNRYFIDKHFDRQKFIIIYTPPRLLPPLPLLSPDEQPFRDLYYLRGLSLEQNTINNVTYRIRNYVNQVFELPDIKGCQFYSSMCYLPTSDEYKVMHLHWKEDDTNISLKVLTKGTDVTWRSVEIPLLMSCSKNSGDKLYSRTVGNVNYIMKLSTFSKSKMMAFQFEDESFVEISLPSRVEFCATGSRFRVMKWDSNVSIGGMVGQELHIWVLHDHKTSKWDERKIVFPSDVIKHYPFIVKLYPFSILDSEIQVLHPPRFNELKQVNYNIKTKVASVARMTQMIKPSLVSL